MTDLATVFAKAQVKGWSAPATLRQVAGMIADLDWSAARVADVGAGRGSFSKLVGETLRAQLGLEPRDHVFACDLIPDSFEYDGIDCVKTAPDGSLPFDDASFDAVVSIEVIEHVEDQFAFLRELARIAKPGAPVIVTTPNTLNANSRLRTLTQGFPVLYDPLPLSTHDPRLLGGHIHPISPYFLVYGALRAGLVEPSLHVDRHKLSATWMAALLWPAIALGGALQSSRLRRKHPEILAENRALIARQQSWDLLTSRTAILRAETPRNGD